MPRRMYGGSPADFTYNGDKSVPGVTLAVATRDETTGTYTRVTTGLAAYPSGRATTTITSDAAGEVRFYGTDLPSDLWITTVDTVGNLGTTWYVMHAADLGSRLDRAVTSDTVRQAVTDALAPYKLDQIEARLSTLEDDSNTLSASAPVNVAAALTSGQTRSVTVTWAAPVVNASAVTSYEVTATPTVASYGSPVVTTVGATGTLTATFPNLAQGATYGIAVVALVGTTRGPAGVATVAVPAPAPATGGTPTTTVTLQASANRLDVAWTLPSGAVSTVVGRNGTDTGGGGAYSTAALPAPTTTTSFTYLDPAQTYTITVTITMGDGSTVVGTATGSPTALPTDTTGGSSGGSTTTPTTNPVAGVVTTSDNPVRRAQEFVDSCGVAIHMTYSWYSDYAKVKTALDYLGVTHVRDGFGTSNAPNATTRSNIGAFFKANPYLRLCMIFDNDDWNGESPSAQLAELDRIGLTPSIELIEGPNESDLSGTAAVSAAGSYLRARIDPFRARGIKIASPSLANTNQDSLYQTLGSSNVDFVTFHDYPGTDRMMNDTIARTKKRNGNYVLPGKQNVPCISTEHGWATSANGDQGKSMPPSGPFTHQHLRVYLECFKGLPGTTWNYRTYKYQLRDYDGTNVENSFGFFDSNWAAKPAATAVRNMLSILKDPSPSSLSFTPASMPGFTVTGGSGTTRRLVMQKATGQTYVALWEQQVTWNGSTTLNPSGSNVSVSWSGAQDVKVYKPSAGPTPTTSSNGTSVSVTSTFDPIIIEIGNASSTGSTGGGSTSGSTTTTPVTPSYTPASAPSVVSWWHVDAATTDGANLATYPAGASGTTAMAAGGTTRGVYRASGLAAGKAGVEFTPDSNQLGGPAYVDGTPLNGASTATIAGTFLLPSSGTLTGSQMTIAGRELVWKLSVEADQRPKLLVSSNGTSWAVNATTANALSRGVPYVYTILIGGGNAVLRINGAQVLSVGFTGSLATATSSFTVAGTDGSGAYPLRGITGDQVISSALLTGTNLSNLEGYLAGTAGVSLP
jgi:hypothetical protein